MPEDPNSPLANELIKRNTPDPLPAYDYYSSNIPENYGLRSALAQLQSIGSPQVGQFTLKPAFPLDTWGGGERNASVDPRNPNQINIFASKVFNRANKGNPEAIRQLAGIIGHEENHILHGPDEGNAYNVQLDILRRLGAHQDAIKDVTDSRNLVTSIK